MTDGPTEDAEDDGVAVIRPLGAQARVGWFPIPHALNYRGNGVNQNFGPIAFGNGRVLIHDDRPRQSAAGPHGLHLLKGFADDVLLEAKRIELEMLPGQPVSAKAVARFSMPDPERFASADLEIRLGEAYQTIPAQALVSTSHGFVYRDPQGSAGFFRRIEYEVARRRLVVRGGGEDGSVVRPNSENLVLSLESTEFYAAQSVEAEEVAGRLLYNAP